MANERFKVGWYRTYYPFPPNNNNIPVSPPLSRMPHGRQLDDGQAQLGKTDEDGLANTLLQDLYHSSVTTMC